MRRYALVVKVLESEPQTSRGLSAKLFLMIQNQKLAKSGAANLYDKRLPKD
jgi:hypothetical protein